MLTPALEEIKERYPEFGFKNKVEGYDLDTPHLDVKHPDFMLTILNSDINPEQFGVNFTSRLGLLIPELDSMFVSRQVVDKVLNKLKRAYNL